jgi:lipoate-protein ligase B
MHGEPGGAFFDLGFIPFEEARIIQLGLLEARVNGRVLLECVLLCQHPSVLTLGRRGGMEHLLIPDQVLNRMGVRVVPTERGGLITYHGPGQLVVYPIFSLRRLGVSVVDYVWRIEETMIRTLSKWGIEAWREPRLGRGVWTEGGKIGSIGIAVRRGITFHGFSLNINGGMEGFSWINPCGIPSTSVTTMERILGRALVFPDVGKSIIREMEELFGIPLRELPQGMLLEWISVDRSGPRIDRMEPHPRQESAKDE